MAKAEETINKIDATLTKSNSAFVEIEECLKTSEETRTTIQQHLIKLNTLQSLEQYLKVLQYVENLRLLHIFLNRIVL